MSDDRLTGVEGDLRRLRGDLAQVARRLSELIDVLLDPDRVPREATDPWGARLARFRERAREREPGRSAEGGR